MNLRDPFRFRTLVNKAKQPSSRPSVRMLQVITLESQKSRLPQMAAALSYRTVFGLLPMIVVALVAMRFFITDREIDHFVTRALDYAGLEAIALDPPEPRTPDEGAFFDDPDAPPAIPPAINDGPIPTGEDGLVTPQDVSRSELADTIRSLITRAKQIDYRAIGLIGFITLIYAAISMLTEIERCFNQIFRVPVGKPWRRRILEYWALLTLGTPCLVATFFVGEKFKAMVESALASTGLSASGVAGIVLSGYAITVVISTLLLLLLYTILPNTRIRIVPALAGALLAAILWEAGKWGFTQYLRYSTSYARLYGSIALIPLFLLWIYATWGIVLFGLHVTYHIQRARSGKNTGEQPIEWSDPPSGVVDPGTMVAVVHAAARGFLTGKPVSLTSIVHSTRVDGAIVNDMVTRLVDAGLLYRVTVADDPNHVALALAPERIKVRSLLDMGYEMAGPAPKEGAAPGIRDRLRDAHLAAAGEQTVADLLTRESGGPRAETPIPLAPTPSSNKIQPETAEAGGANVYPPERDDEDTLPLRIEGDPERDQESTPNGVGDRPGGARGVRDAGVLHPDG